MARSKRNKKIETGIVKSGGSSMIHVPALPKDMQELAQAAFLNPEGIDAKRLTVLGKLLSISAKLRRESGEPSNDAIDVPNK